MPGKTTPVLLPFAFAVLWWLLTDGQPESWLVGVPVVIAASWAARRLGTGASGAISAWGAVRFLPLFAWESLRGGLDVARRTLAPRLRVRPGFADYQTGLERHAARVFFANCVCLLPGTLAADLRGSAVRIHLLDDSVDPQAELQRLEHAVALVYGQAECKPGTTTP